MLEFRKKLVNRPIDLITFGNNQVGGQDKKLGQLARTVGGAETSTYEASSRTKRREWMRDERKGRQAEHRCARTQ